MTKLSVTWQRGEWTLALRPVREEDGPLWLEFMRAMSFATRYKRGARRAEDLRPEDVCRAVTPDPASELVFVAAASRGQDTRMVGVARGRRTRPDAWEFAIVVLDNWQKAGIGLSLMRALIDAIEERGAQRIEGDVLATNRDMLKFLGRLGFEAHIHHANPHLKRVVRNLAPRSPSSTPCAG